MAMTDEEIRDLVVDAAVKQMDATLDLYAAMAISLDRMGVMRKQVLVDQLKDFLAVSGDWPVTQGALERAIKDLGGEAPNGGRPTWLRGVVDGGKSEA